MKKILAGIGGGSASGKSYLSEKLAEMLAGFKSEIIHTDRFFKPVKPQMISRFSGNSFDDFNQPESWDFAAYHEALASALGGEAQVVIVEGVFAIFEPEVREKCDLTIFVDTSSDERFYRRIKRRMALGITLEEEADYFLGTQRFRHEEFYEPLKSHADIIINGSNITERKVAVIAAYLKSLI